MIEVSNGEPLPNDEDAIEVYGMRPGAINDAFGARESEMLIDKTFKIIYGFNKSSGAASKTSKKTSKMIMM